MSEFFSNGKHTIGQVDGNSALNKNINITINGLYVANNTGDKVLNSLHIKQFGHITLNGKKINSPSYVVLKGQEDEIGFYPSSPVAKQIEEYNKNKNEKATEE